MTLMSKFHITGFAGLILALLVNCEGIGQSISFLEGNSANLHCQYEGGEVKSIIWMHQNRASWDLVIQQSGGESKIIGNGYSSQRIDLDDDSTSLVIRNLSISDDGYYKCTVFTSAPTEWFLKLHVIVHPVHSNPVISQCNDSGLLADCTKSVSAGSLSYLSCEMRNFHPADGAAMEWRLESGHSALTHTSAPKRNDDNTYSLQSSVNVSVLVPERLWCNVSYLSEHGTQHSGSSVYLTPVPNEEIYPTITQCQQSFVPGKCIYHSQSNDAQDLTCEIESLYVPKYVSLEWRGEDERILPSRATVVSKNKNTSMLRITTSVLTSETETLWCNLSYDRRVGLNGSATTIQVIPVTSSSTTRIIGFLVVGLIILCAAAIGVRCFILYNGNEVPYLHEVDRLKSSILGYTGDGSTHIGLVGAAAVGKSSLINTVATVLGVKYRGRSETRTRMIEIFFGLSANYREVFDEIAAPAPSNYMGGYTQWREPVKMTKHVTICDNRGWDDWTNENACKELKAQIDGTSSGWENVNWDGSTESNLEAAKDNTDHELSPLNPKLTTVILVLNGYNLDTTDGDEPSDTTGGDVHLHAANEDLHLGSTRGVKQLRDTVFRALGKIPLIVVTHADLIEESEICRIRQHLREIFNIEDKRLFFIENAREEKPKVEPSSRLVVLRLINQCIRESKTFNKRLEIKERQKRKSPTHHALIQ